jgi:hypothetical protein
MTTGHSILLVCAGLAAATLSLPAQGDTVQGIATVGTTRVALRYRMAVGSKAPNGSLISAVLSDKPLDTKAFAEDTKIGPGEPLVAGLFEGAWKSPVGRGPRPTARCDASGWWTAGSMRPFELGDHQFDRRLPAFSSL